MVSAGATAIVTGLTMEAQVGTPMISGVRAVGD
jgi:hypothetical protein